MYFLCDVETVALVVAINRVLMRLAMVRIVCRLSRDIACCLALLSTPHHSVLNIPQVCGEWPS